LKEESRNRIILFSFVLTVFVIWLHAGESLISSIPGQIAVPGFFILSGFLFFRGVSGGQPDSDPGEAADTGAEKKESVPPESVMEEAAGTETEKKGSVQPGTGQKADGRPGSGQEENSQSENGQGDRGSSGKETKEGFLPLWMRAKLKRRVHTLLIPYLLWNFLYFLIYLVFGKAELSEIFSAVFLYSCNPVFWYLQQLILITLVTPFLYPVLKRKTAAVIWLILIFAAAVLYGQIHAVINVTLINEDALFYYSLGAFLSLYIYKEETDAAKNAAKDAVKDAAKDAAEKNNRFGWEDVFSCAVGFAAPFLLGSILPEELNNLEVILTRTAGALFTWFLIERIPRVKIYPWMKITFFIYATHYMVIRLVWAAETALGLNGSASANIVTYLMMPAFCVAAAYGIYLLMKKFTPKFLAVLTGNRGN